MKNFRCLSYLLLMLFLFSLTASAWADGAKAIAVVLSTKGKAEINKGSAGWDKLKFGTVLDDGDKLRTGDDGFIALVFTDDKSQVKIRPNSEVTISAERDEEYNLAKTVNMQIGELFVDVTRQKGSMQVATPTAVASVKGTEFWVVVNIDGEVNVFTLEGVVALLSLKTGLEEDVIEGMLGTVDENGHIEIGDIIIDIVPELPEDLDVPDFIEIKFRDESGNEKTLIIEYEVNE